MIRERDKDIPIVALTANAMKEDIDKSIRAGMNNHLNKPINVEKLYQTLLQYLKVKDNSVAEVTSSNGSPPESPPTRRATQT